MALRRRQKTLRNLEWFEVTQIKGHIVDGGVGHYQSLHEAWTSLRPEVTRRQFRISRGVPLRLHPGMVLNTIHEQSP